MSPQDRKLMEEARDALYKLHDTVTQANREVGMNWGHTFGAIMTSISLADISITKLTERLAQPETEPRAWIWKYANGEEEVVFVPPRHIDPTYSDAPSTITPLYTHQSPDVELVRQLVDVAVFADRLVPAKHSPGITAAIEAGQQWLKERGK